MFQVQQGRMARNCQGMSRRSALKVGFLGLMGLSLPELFRLRAAGAAQDRGTACILLWLDGGPSQLETYDPKPEAPAEYRGPFGAIATNVPGIRISETLPRHARHADKMVFIRSLHHDNGDHFAGAHWMLTGHFGSNAANLAQKFPSVGSYVSRVRGANQPGLPAYVGLPAAESVYLFPGYQGAAYLGPEYNPFDVDREQKYLGATSTLRITRPKCFEGAGQVSAERARDRVGLLASIDGLRRDLDRSGTADTMDRYQQQALEMILGGKARAAFDLRKTPRWPTATARDPGDSTRSWRGDSSKPASRSSRWTCHTGTITPKRKKGTAPRRPISIWPSAA